MAASEESSDQLSPAAEVFADFLARQENGEEPDFDAFCAQHAELAPKLRRLHVRWRDLDGAFGGEVEPGISLDDLGPDAPRGARGSRYEDAELIARGGMGEIKRVWDPELRRSLAMKVLLTGEPPARSKSGATRARHDPRSLGRFLEEAQVTAQLHHPGIVPVHELGLDDDGRVYFTMALVRGRTLGSVIELARQERDGWNRTRALGVLQRVCEAVAFAHSKGVIHRDLKPANVMVGNFGETYVMDWGLAHVDGSEGREEIHSWRQEAATGEEDSPLMTMAGDVIGTPAYMPPEQARGEIERVGPQADVYSVGAMLYQLLTGRMPFDNEDQSLNSRAVLALVVAGPPVPVDQIDKSVPGELVAICSKAMARDPKERYPTVQEMGEDLRAFLEIRVVRAHASGTWAELKKWVRRNKALTAASAAAVLALALGLVFSLREKARADEHATRSEANFTLAMDAIDRMLTRVGDKSLANVPRMDAVRREVLQDALELNQKVLASRGDDPRARLEVARAHQRVGLIHGKLGEFELAETAQRKAIAVFEVMIAEDPDNPKLRADLVWSRNPLASFLLSRGRSKEAKAILEEALVGMEQVVAMLPDDPTQRARHAIVLGQLGIACFWLKERQAALDNAVRALEIREGLSTEFPDNLVYRHGAAVQCINVGHFYQQLKRDAEAEATYKKGIARMRELLEVNGEERDYRDDIPVLLSNLGIVQMQMGEAGNRKAVENLREAVARNRALVADFPEAPTYRRSLGASLSNLGQALMNLRDLTAARTSLEEAIRETKVALATLPDDPQVRGYVGRQHSKLFRVLMALRLHREAAECAGSYAGHASIDPPLILSQATGWLGLCANLVRKDKNLTAAEQGEHATGYLDRAIVLLQRAVDAGFKDAKTLEHANYNALRERADWQPLVEVVKARAAEGK